MDTNILLESGTNELEILEFVVDGHNYGINVAKIREIISYTELTPIPNAHPFVEGAFSTRGETITVVNLAKCLGMNEREEKKTDMFSVMRKVTVILSVRMRAIRMLLWDHL